MSTQRKLLAVLLLFAAVLAILLAIALRAGRAEIPTDPVREKEAKPPAPAPSEPTESTEGRNSLVPATIDRPARPAPPAHQPGPPVKIVGRIGDAKGNGLDAVDVLVYDSRGEPHQPEVLRPDWYECTIHERGRAPVVAKREESCSAEVPLEVLEPDVERHIDLLLPARPVLCIHVRDLAGKPLPRFGKDQPLRAKLRAVASVEDLPAQLTAPMTMQATSTEPDARLGWAEFEPESLMHLLGTRAGMHLPGAARGKPRQGNSNRKRLPWTIEREIEWDASNLDDARFDSAVTNLRGEYKRRMDTDGHLDEGDPMRLFLAALGYVGEDGTPIEGESPERDIVGTLTLVRPLPLRISLFAGQRLLESQDPLPWSEDVLFKIDLERLAESYVHAYLFANDAKTGARLPGTLANLHVEPLAGGPEQQPEFSRSIAQGYAGREAPDYMGAPKGWRFPETDVTTDADGRADFPGALAGWCRLTLKADGHVPVSKWVCVERAPESYLGFFELAPCATSRLSVVDPEGAGARVNFELRPLLHAKDSEGTQESWKCESDAAGLLLLKDIGRQQLLLRSADPDWALEPAVLDNTQGLVDNSTLHVIPARHVLVHLPLSLPLDAIVNIAQGLTRPVYEECYAGKTLIDLWLADGTYTLRVSEGFTALLTTKFSVAGEPLLVEIAP